jgi:hypothetical protein
MVELGDGGPIIRGESRGKHSSSVRRAPMSGIKRSVNRPIEIKPR